MIARLEFQSSYASKNETVNLPGSHAPLFPQKRDQEPEQKADAEGGNYSQEDHGRTGKRVMDERKHGSKTIQHRRT